METCNTIINLKLLMLLLRQTFRHGFPYQPTVLAYDPVQNILAIGSKTGALRMYPLYHIYFEILPRLRIANDTRDFCCTTFLLSFLLRMVAGVATSCVAKVCNKNFMCHRPYAVDSTEYVSLFRINLWTINCLKFNQTHDTLNSIVLDVFIQKHHLFSLDHLINLFLNTDRPTVTNSKHSQSF